MTWQVMRADADRLRLGIAGAEELLAHRLADEAHAGAAAHLATRVNARPDASFQSRAIEIAVVGAGDVDRRGFRCRRPRAPAFCDGGRDGAARRSGRARSAATSLSSSGARRELAVAPGPAGRPARTTSRLLPSLAMSALTFSVVPLPIVTMAMTAATPMTMPSRVRNERSTLRRIGAQREADGFAEHHAASIASVVGCDVAVEEADGAPRIGGDVGLVRDHHDGQAELAVERGQQRP